MRYILSVNVNRELREMSTQVMLVIRVHSATPEDYFLCAPRGSSRFRGFFTSPRGARPSAIGVARFQLSFESHMLCPIETLPNTVASRLREEASEF